ncbi:MAG: ABC transporter ATP-binding protein [Thermodesulfovibrionales bacterium]|nr:ABC transporter ATP-binding protein [Thermodesulfovibrionales bacterium]
MRELIKIEGLEKSYFTPAGELKVLKGVDGIFNEGEIVSIVGVSGVGKSTFLHILGTLDKPTSGKVLYKTNKGSEIDPFSLSNGELASFRNKAIGFVFQFHYLLPEFSALENVIMPGMISMGSRGQGIKESRYKEFYEKAERLLDELGIYARKDHKPGELSGGEQQRVAVARALLLEPKLILADEPTGNLDAATGDELFRVLKGINEKSGVTFIIVTHNEQMSRKCRRTLEMVDGRLIDRL